MAALIFPSLQTETLAMGLDVDGVLRDTAYGSYLGLCKTVQELGGKIPLFDHFVRNYESDFEAYYRECGVVNVEQIYPAYTRHVGNIDDAPPFPDVVDFLSHMHSLGLTVFTVSSHPTEKLTEWFLSHGIHGRTMCVYGGSRDKRICIRKACEQIGVNPSLACYVGDLGVDIRAAAAAGVVPIGITRGYGSRPGLIASGAAHVVDHLCELSRLIR